jgi:hypothetical protein
LVFFTISHPPKLACCGCSFPSPHVQRIRFARFRAAGIAPPANSGMPARNRPPKPV